MTNIFMVYRDPKGELAALPFINPLKEMVRTLNDKNYMFKIAYVEADTAGAALRVVMGTQELMDIINHGKPLAEIKPAARNDIGKLEAAEILGGPTRRADPVGDMQPARGHTAPRSSRGEHIVLAA